METGRIKRRKRRRWLGYVAFLAVVLSSAAVLCLAMFFRTQEIVVVVPVDGTLRLASGAVYDFYQFTWPMENRLTDTQWRQMIGEWAGPDGNYYWEGRDSLVKPAWTESYRSELW